MLFASFYNFQYCKEVYSGVQSVFFMHNVCPHSTLSALAMKIGRERNHCKKLFAFPGFFFSSSRGKV